MSMINQRGDWRGYCWFWDGDRDDDYQPVFEVNGVHHSPEHILHQHLCGIPVDEAKPIKSECHVAGCINPSHKVGGQNAQRKKLKQADVLWILDSDKSAHDLAEEFGVSKSTIRNVRSGRTWKDIERVKPVKSTPKKPHRKLVRVGAAGIKFDPDTGKYVASYYKKHIGESDSLEGAVALRQEHIKGIA